MNRAPSLTLAAVATTLILTARPGDANAPAGHFSIGTGTAAGTVYDTKTGLTWQQATAPGTYTVTAGTAYCQALPLNGAGWRLPRIGELQTILDLTQTAGPYVDGMVFPGTQNNLYWASTFAVGYPSYVWAVAFNAGNANYYAMSNAYYVRCVR